jgi:hypothetical protein
MYFSFINKIFVDFQNKNSDYFLTRISPKSDNFPQSRLLQLGHKNIVISNPSEYSIGIIKTLLQVLQWFMVIMVSIPPIHNIWWFQYKYFTMKEFIRFRGF